MVAAPKQPNPATECLALWNRWTAAVSDAADRRNGNHRLSREKYQTLHDELLQSCRRAATAEQNNPIYHRMEGLAAPWINQEVFSHTDRHILHALLQQCDELSSTVGGQKRRRIKRARLPSLIAAISALLGVLYLSGYDDFTSVSLEGRRIIRQFQFSLADSDFLQTFSVSAVVAIAAGMWFVNSVKKS